MMGQNFFFVLLVSGGNLLWNKKPPNKKIGGLAVFQAVRIRPEDP
jgi:hypothetical protein